MSKGDFIQWLDADDLLAPDKIALQMAVLEMAETPRTIATCSWGHFMYRPTKAKFLPSTLWRDLSPCEFLLQKLECKVFMQTAVWLVSREVTEAAGPWNTELLGDDDGEYFCRIILNGASIRFVQSAKVYYRQTGTGSLSYVGRSTSKLDAMWTSMQLHIRYMLQIEDSERTRNGCIHYLQNYLSLFHRIRPDITDQLHQLSRQLGGNLHDPQLPSKYSWICPIAGWTAGRRAQLYLPRLKWACVRLWEKLVYLAESARGTNISDVY